MGAAEHDGVDAGLKERLEVAGDEGAGGGGVEGAGFDGVMAKPAAGTYVEDKRCTRA